MNVLETVRWIVAVGLIPYSLFCMALSVHDFLYKEWSLAPVFEAFFNGCLFAFGVILTIVIVREM